MLLNKVLSFQWIPLWQQLEHYQPQADYRAACPNKVYVLQASANSFPFKSPKAQNLRCRKKNTSLSPPFKKTSKQFLEATIILSATFPTSFWIFEVSPKEGMTHQLTPDTRQPPTSESPGSDGTSARDLGKH